MLKLPPTISAWMFPRLGLSSWGNNQTCHATLISLGLFTSCTRTPPSTPSELPHPWSSGTCGSLSSKPLTSSILSVNLPCVFIFMFLNHFIGIRLTCKKLCIFNVYNLVSVEINIDGGDGFTGIHLSPSPAPPFSVLAQEGALLPHSPLM